MIPEPKITENGTLKSADVLEVSRKKKNPKENPEKVDREVETKFEKRVSWKLRKNRA